jgi:hypothetical protein
MCLLTVYKHTQSMNENKAYTIQRYLTLIDCGLYIQLPSVPWAIFADGAAAHLLKVACMETTLKSIDSN